MTVFRKKSVAIEAVQYNGRNTADIHEFCGSVVLEPVIPNGTMPFLEIVTLEGNMKAIPSDWIIKGVNGEFYPCKPDVFEKTYENEEQISKNSIDKINSFKEAATPLMVWMKKNCNPHSRVIVDQMNAELLSGEIGIPSEYNIEINRKESEE